jgi:hypothetical protein
MKKSNKAASQRGQKRAVKNKKRQQEHPRVSAFEKKLALKRLMIVQEYLKSMRKDA